ncbi:CopG family ribbon-helix-helix protein [Halorubrum tibetense]|uniref:CopG family ribbon-helix-helix protein n=1 Tax=Halorubrum tibetense TaxID=175631 RepID=A0ABD5SAI8_9EURY
MPVVSVSMPESLLNELDDFIEDHGYSGRSEAVREGARGLIDEFDMAEFDGEVACMIAARFEHDSTAEASLSELRHAHAELVTSSVHSHAGGACLELFVVEGSIDTISAYVARIRAVNGVNTVEYSVLESTERAIA